MFDLKNALKTLKLNESTISMLLGALVVLAVGFMIVNYIRGRTTVPKGTTSIPAATTQEERRANLPVTHKVVQGESLWKISEKYYGSGYNWVDIAKENSLANPNRILADQSLVVPNVEVRQPLATATGGITVSPGRFGESISGDSYTVVKGDHLWGIAVRAYGDGYQWVKIWRENTSQVKNPNLIYPNQTFKIPRS